MSDTSKILATKFTDDRFPIEWKDDAEKGLMWFYDDLHCPNPISPLYFDIGGWWGADPLPNAKIAVEVSNGEKDLVNMQCFRWMNPHPEKLIRSLDLISAQTEAVPAIAAVTLEMP